MDTSILLMKAHYFITKHIFYTILIVYAVEDMQEKVKPQIYTVKQVCVLL